MTTLINQRYPTDCMIAAIAMALSLPYEEVYTAAIDCGAYKEDHSEGIRNEDTILKHLGLDSKYEAGAVHVGDFRGQHKDYAISAEYFRSKLWGRPCIICLPSLNKAGGWHAIYYDGFEVFDPNPPSRNCYASDSFDSLLPHEAIIFRPNVSDILKAKRAAKSLAST